MTCKRCRRDDCPTLTVSPIGAGLDHALRWSAARDDCLAAWVRLCTEAEAEILPCPHCGRVVLAGRCCPKAGKA